MKLKRKQPKRSALLIDEVLQIQDKNIPRAWQEPVHFIQGRLRAAKVFKFDAAAARYAAQMIVAHPEAIAHDLEFAIPPFERMYIEFPYPEFYSVTSPPEFRGYSNIPPEEDDLDVGYLYDGPNVYVLSRAGKEANLKYPMVMPLRYRLNRALTFQEEQHMAGVLQESRLGLDALYWGSCYKTLVEKRDNESAKALRRNNSCEFWYGTEMPSEALSNTLISSAGDLRNIVAMILFLNRTRDVQFVDELPPAPGFVRAKPRTLVRHNVIRLRLDPGPLLQRIFKGRATGGWKREHDVRGHFCHDKVWRAYKHEHDTREIDIHHWKCILCGGNKWWRKEHHRGRRDIGQVKTAYEVAK